MSSPGLPSLQSTIARHGLLAKKSLGQHFLLDENLTTRIAHAAGDLTGCTVIEIGPGPGGLTRALLAANAARVVAVEKDARCVAALQELQTAYPGRLEIVEADALDVDLPAITSAPRKIVANLPYNVGTPLLIQWLGEVYAALPRPVEERDVTRCLLPVASKGKSESAGNGKRGTGNVSPKGSYLSLTLMFQREVARRITASPGGKEYGRLSVMSQWLCDAVHHFDLPPGAFVPPPKIHSSVITLTPRLGTLYPCDKAALEKVLAAAFGQRRKMLRQSLKTLGVPVESLLETTGIDGMLRGEVLDIEAFCRLANNLKNGVTQ